MGEFLTVVQLHPVVSLGVVLTLWKVWKPRRKVRKDFGNGRYPWPKPYQLRLKG